MDIQEIYYTLTAPYIWQIKQLLQGTQMQAYQDGAASILWPCLEFKINVKLEAETACHIQNPD